MKITVLVDNKTENPDCEAEWGLSLLVEAYGKKILFDTGASDMFIRNAAALQIDLSTVDDVVISHGHYDHTGGILELLKINNKCKVYMRENALRDYYEKEDGAYLNAGVRWTPEQTKAISNRLVFTKDREFLDDSIELLSNIPSGKDSYTENNFYWLSDDLQYIADDMSHEQILVVHDHRKMFVFSGCCHSGVISTLDYLKKIYPNKTIEAFVAGMHLYGQNESVLNNLLDDMEKYGVNYYVPLHCTGMEAIVQMKKRFEKRCIVATTGDEISQLDI